MKNSFQLLTVFGLCASMGLSALAAPPAGAPKTDRMGGKMGGGKMGRGGMRGMGMMGRMAKELGLTDAQKAKLKTINKAQMPQMKALRDNKSLTEDQKKAKMKEMRTANMKKMMAVLTPEQRKKMAAMRKEQRAKGDDKMKAAH